MTGQANKKDGARITGRTVNRKETMCTRYFIEPESPELLEILQAAKASPLARRFVHAGSPVLTEGEIFPSNVVPALAPDKSGRPAVFPMKWGFHVPGIRPLLNARCESAGEKKTFREAWRKSRCILPASCYYEWEHLPLPSGKTRPGTKYAIQPTDSTVTWLCGLYRIEDGFPCFVVLTREPTEALRRIHDRMPLILPKSRIPDWLDPQTEPEELLPLAVTDLTMVPA